MKDPNSIMAPSQKKTAILTNDSVFVNAECLFVEYYDVIKAPWFVFMALSRHSEIIQSIVDMGYMVDVDRLGWLEWYMYRSDKNPLKSFPPNPEFVKAHGLDGYDSILDLEMDNTDIIDNDAHLPFYDVLQRLLNGMNVVKELRIWTPTYHKTIEDVVYNDFGKGVTYVSGKLEDVLKDVPKDTTYIFSDITHVLTLEKEDRLKMVSIILAEHYRYNYNEDGTLKVDIDKLMEDHIFNFFLMHNRIIN